MSKFKNQNKFVIITVPHSVCPTNKIPGKHECDYRALNIANLLAQMLKGKKIDFKMIQSEVLRSDVDVNRSKINLKPFKQSSIAAGAWDKFQNAVSNTIIENSNKDILLLDIHSFDNINSFCKKGKDDCYITILDVQNKNRPELRDFASKVETGFTVNVSGGGKNYIINTYGEIYIPQSPNLLYPLLLEFFEDTSILTDEQIRGFFDQLLEYPFLNKMS